MNKKRFLKWIIKRPFSGNADIFGYKYVQAKSNNFKMILKQRNFPQNVDSFGHMYKNYLFKEI